jgi:hypothetical protein
MNEFQNVFFEVIMSYAMQVYYASSMPTKFFTANRLKFNDPGYLQPSQKMKTRVINDSRFHFLTQLSLIIIQIDLVSQILPDQSGCF